MFLGAPAHAWRSAAALVAVVVSVTVVVSKQDLSLFTRKDLGSFLALHVFGKTGNDTFVIQPFPAGESDEVDNRTFPPGVIWHAKTGAYGVRPPVDALLFFGVSVLGFNVSSGAEVQTLQVPPPYSDIDPSDYTLLRLDYMAPISGVARKNLTFAAENLTVYALYYHWTAGNAYCERARPNVTVAQPCASFSSLAFLASGTVMFVSGLYADRGVMLFSTLNGLVNIFGGVASFLFHAALTGWAHFIDMASVLMLVIVPLLFVCQKLELFGPCDSEWARHFFVGFVCLSFILIITNAVPSSGASTIAVAVLAAILGVLLGAYAFRHWGTARRRVAGAGTVCIAVAFACRQVDVEKTALCDPDGPFQLHAVWHVLSALFFALLWGFLR